MVDYPFDLAWQALDTPWFHIKVPLKMAKESKDSFLILKWWLFDAIWCFPFFGVRRVYDLSIFFGDSAGWSQQSPHQFSHQKKGFESDWSLSEYWIISCIEIRYWRLNSIEDITLCFYQNIESYYSWVCAAPAAPAPAAENNHRSPVYWSSSSWWSREMYYNYLQRIRKA